MPIGGFAVNDTGNAKQCAQTASEARGKPFKSGKQAREMGRRGGTASGRARRERRAMREIASELLGMPMRKGKTEAYKSFIEGSTKNVTVAERIMMVAIKEAMEGNVRAAEFVRDTAGEKPTDALEVTAGSAEASERFMQLLDLERGDGD